MTTLILLRDTVAQLQFGSDISEPARLMLIGAMLFVLSSVIKGRAWTRTTSDSLRRIFAGR